MRAGDASAGRRQRRVAAVVREGQREAEPMHGNYWRFAAMIATSTLVMFGLMYVHTYAWHHAYFSETRA
ncbi:MAG: hypothetical protein AB7I13_03200, partial [Vicinamibacterales bacterium]